MNELIYIVIGSLIGGVTLFIINKISNKKSVDNAKTSADKILNEARAEADNIKNSKILQAKENAKSQLNPTDWYVVRKAEVGTAFSDEISAYRTAVRTCYGNLKTAINAASDVDELAAVYAYSSGASQDAKTVNPSKVVPY